MTQVSPSRSITIAGKTYTLDGSLATLRAVQEFFQKDIVHVLVTITDMRLDEIANLAAIGAGIRHKADEIGQDILDEVGPLKSDYLVLKTQLIAWLNIAMTPKAEREKKSAEMDAMIAKQTPSPGQTTSDSPSAPSDGNPQNSGDPTFGN